MFDDGLAERKTPARLTEASSTHNDGQYPPLRSQESVTNAHARNPQPVWSVQHTQTPLPPSFLPSLPPPCLSACLPCLRFNSRSTSKNRATTKQRPTNFRVGSGFLLEEKRREEKRRKTKKGKKRRTSLRLRGERETL